MPCGRMGELRQRLECCRTALPGPVRPPALAEIPGRDAEDAADARVRCPIPVAVMVICTAGDDSPRCTRSVHLVPEADHHLAAEIPNAVSEHAQVVVVVARGDPGHRGTVESHCTIVTAPCASTVRANDAWKPFPPAAVVPDEVGLPTHRLCEAGDRLAGRSVVARSRSPYIRGRSARLDSVASATDGPEGVGEGPKFLDLFNLPDNSRKRSKRVPDKCSATSS